MSESTGCANCRGAGKIVGFGCPGFRRIELECEVCKGSGIAPAWQADAVREGKGLKARRSATDRTLREEAARLGISPVDLSAAELGKRPTSEWPIALLKDWAGRAPGAIDPVSQDTEPPPASREETIEGNQYGDVF